MTSPRRSPKFRDLAFALRALFAVVAAIALFAYAISAWQVYGFARYVWELPEPLSFGAAGVADLLSLSGLFATYLLRDANIRVRAYAWSVFGLMTTLSILAAESFAGWRRLSQAQKAAYTHIDAQFAAGAIVVALALATHLLIVCVRHASDGLAAEPESPRARSPKPPAATGEKGADPAPPSPDETRQLAGEPKQRPARPRRAGRRGRPPIDKEAAVRRVLGGESAAAVARSIDQHPRNVQNWVKAWKLSEAVGFQPETPLSGVKPQLTEGVPING